MGGARSTVAAHPERSRIEAALREGTPSSHVAEQFNLSRQAVDRYKTKLRARPAGRGDDDRAAMRGQMQSLYNEVVHLVKQAKAANHPRAFLAATAEARKLLNSISKLLGLLNETPAPTVAVNVQVDIVELRQVIVTALEPFPQARQSVARALLRYDARAPEGEA